MQFQRSRNSRSVKDQYDLGIIICCRGQRTALAEHYFVASIEGFEKMPMLGLVSPPSHCASLQPPIFLSRSAFLAHLPTFLPLILILPLPRLPIPLPQPLHPLLTHLRIPPVKLIQPLHIHNRRQLLLLPFLPMWFGFAVRGADQDLRLRGRGAGNGRGGGGAGRKGLLR